MLFVFSHIQVCFVQRQGFHQIGIFKKNGTDLPRNLFILIHPRGNKDQPGTLPQSRDRGHGRMHPKPAGFVTGRGHHASPSFAANGNGATPQFRMIALFNGCVKGIHIHVDYFLRVLHATKVKI